MAHTEVAPAQKVKSVRSAACAETIAVVGVVVALSAHNGKAREL